MKRWNADRIREVLAIESEAFAERLASPEFAEAARAFFERRKPDFSRFD